MLVCVVLCVVLFVSSLFPGLWKQEEEEEEGVEEVEKVVLGRSEIFNKKVGAPLSP